MIPAILLMLAVEAASPASGKAPASAKAKPAASAVEKPAAQAPDAPAAPTAPAPAASAESQAAASAAADVAPEPASEARPKLLRVAVLDASVRGEVPDRALQAFVSSLVPELRKLQAVMAVGTAEIREMIAFDRERTLLGCQEESCLAEIAGALGVDEIVSTELSLLGNSYTLVMRRINVRKARVLQAESRQFEARDGEELLALVGDLVAALYPERPLKEGRKRGVEAAVIRRLNPPPLPRWVTLATAGAAVAATGVGIGYGLQARGWEDQFNREAQRSLQQQVQGATLKELENNAKDSAFQSNLFYTVAGGLAVVTAVEFFFTDWHDDRSAPVVTPMVGGGTVGVGASGSF